MRLGVVLRLSASFLKSGLRNRSNVFWTFVFPIMLLTFLALVFATPGQGFEPPKVALVPGDNAVANLTSMYATYMNESGLSPVVLSSGLDEALSMLRRGEYRAVVYVPEDAAEAAENTTVRVVVYVLTGAGSPVEEEYVRRVLLFFFREAGKYMVYARVAGIAGFLANSSAAEDPVTGPVVRELATVSRVMWNNTKLTVVEVKPAAGEGYSTRGLVVASMAISVVFINFLFGGVLGGSMVLTGLREGGQMARLFSAGLRPWELFASVMVSETILLALPVAPTLVWGMVMGAEYPVSPLSLPALYTAAVMLTALLLTLSIGLLLGLVAPSREGAGIAANIVVWPVMVAGGFWVPKWMLPGFMRAFAEVNPLSKLMYSLTPVILLGRNMVTYLPDIAVSAASTLALLALAALLYRKRLPRLLG